MADADDPTEPPSTTRSGSVTVFSVDPDHPDHERLARVLTDLPAGQVLAPLCQILEIARRGGCRSVVMEHDYTDMDWRSDHGAFWFGRHERFEPLTRRLHFFKAELDAETVYDLSGLEEEDYLGYTVLRPTELGPVGRTVLRPPPEERPTVLCTVSELPSLFGNELRITGVPFMQQDGEMLRCAHTAAWLCHYVGWSRRIVPRKLTAQLAGLSSGGSKHRPMPSSGLTGEQMQSLFVEVELPALFLDVSALPDTPAPMTAPAAGLRERLGFTRDEGDEAKQDLSEEEQNRERLMRVVCKYVNSGFPVVVFTQGKRENHAFTIVGWRDDGDGNVTLIACDDQVGPYEYIDTEIERDAERGKWRSLMVPLPEPVLLTGEAAETRARAIVVGAERRHDKNAQEADLSSFARDLETLRGGDVSIRSRLLLGRDYKKGLRADERGDEAVRLLRLARLPQWVWLVELQSREARSDGRPCVLAEIVFDPTSHDLRPIVATSATRGEAKDNARFRIEGPSDVTTAPGNGGCWSSGINPSAQLHIPASGQRAA